MSEFQIREGQILLHRQDPDGKKPVIKGTCMVNGKEMEVALWPAKSGKQGSYSGKISEKRERIEQSDIQPDQPVHNNMNDEIPF